MPWRHQTKMWERVQNTAKNAWEKCQATLTTYAINIKSMVLWRHSFVSIFLWIIFFSPPSTQGVTSPLIRIWEDWEFLQGDSTVYACMLLYTVNLMQYAWMLCPPLSVSFDLMLYIKHHTPFFPFFLLLLLTQLTWQCPIHYQCQHYILHTEADPFTTDVNTAFCAQKNWPVHYQCKHCILCTETDPFTTNINATLCTQKLPWNTTKIFLSIKQILGD